MIFHSESRASAIDNAGQIGESSPVADWHAFRICGGLE
jgi:hypothetical protein